MSDSTTLKGLPNQGNTCYFNSVIQALNQCKHFGRFMAEHGRQVFDPFVVFDNTDDTYMRVLRAFQTNIVPSQFKVLQQNDAHELMMYLFDFYREKLKNHSGASYEEPVRYDSSTVYDDDISKILSKCNTEWYKDYAPILQTVYIQTVRHTKCGLCGNLCINAECNPFINVDTFEIKRGIQECFTSRFVDDWLCDKCNARSDKSHTSISCSKLPEVLIVCVNRFVTKSEINIPRKLDISMHCIDPQNKQNGYYELKCTINHTGAMHFGHYFMNVVVDKTHVLKIDDESVGKSQSIQLSDLKNAYILFYERSPRRAAGSDIETPEHI